MAIEKRQLRMLLGALGFLLLFGPASARAQSSSEVRDRVDPPAALAGETYLGPHIGYSFVGKYEELYCPCDADQNDFLFIGGRLGHFFTDHFAIEATAQYFHPDRDRIPEYWELTLGGLYDFTPSIPGWNTYLGFGGGLSLHKSFDVGPISREREKAGLAYLAFGSEYRFGKVVGLRVELKGQYNFRSHFDETVFVGSTGSTHRVENPSHFDVQPNIGLLFHFGGHAAPPVVEVAPAPAPPPPPPAPPEAPVAPAPPPAPPVVSAPPPPAPITEFIEFDRGKARLTNIAKAKLDAIALRLRDNPRATVTITGYPDSGSGARQEALARQRAENTKQYLIERHGIDASRITTKIDTTDTASFGKAVVVTVVP